MNYEVRNALLTALHYLPNGGVAVLDENDKMIAYNPTMLDQDGKFAWVKPDARKIKKGVDKQKK
jgi:hypothetical protein